MGKWINFVEQQSKGVTRIFKVISKEDGDNLGTIKWFSTWRCYTFHPEAGTIFEVDCLSDITNFLKDLMDNRKKLKESNTNMKHTKLFEEFIEEAVKETIIEAAQDSMGYISFKGFDKFIGKLSFKEVYKDDKDEKRNEEIKKLMLEKFPASDEWKKECEQYLEAEIYGLKTNVIHASGPNEEVLLAMYKERSQGGEIGQIQLWDESKLTKSVSGGGPFSDLTHTISGKYSGGIFFAKGLSKPEVSKITKTFKVMFPGSGKTKNWIEAN
jgi:hypothetical protein